MLFNNRLPVDRAQSQSHTAVKAYCPPIGLISVIIPHSPPYPIWAQPQKFVGETACAKASHQKQVRVHTNHSY